MTKSHNTLSAPVAALRLATEADADVLALLGGATFLETYAGRLPGRAIVDHCAKFHTEAAWTMLLRQPQCQAWLTNTPGGTPVGYALLTPADIPGQRDGDLELRRIYLLGRWRHMGLGRQLIDAVIDMAMTRNAKRLLLGVWVENRDALGFYAALGFSQVATRQFLVGTLICNDFVLARDLLTT